MELSETTKDQLKKIAYNEKAVFALKELRDTILSVDNVLSESQAETNEIIGERVRATYQAKKIFDDFFLEIETQKEVKELKGESNPVV